jgi:hypothetical protein
MDRKYKAKEKVYVFNSTITELSVDNFMQAPFSSCGFDNYEYKGKMYKGFFCRGSCADDAFSYILLSEPLFKGTK